VLTELLDNVYQHSHTPIAGFVGLQPYRQGANVVLAVSDSGQGLSTTIRQAMPGKVSRLTESDLVVKVFREGLSRLGEGTGRGGGLRRSAVIAIQYGATLHVRLPSAIVRLVPAGREYDKNVAHCRDDAPLLWGTHIHFEFRLTD
jgi:glucose-6-phosphate-specific signal transduction histidine kinase